MTDDVKSISETICKMIEAEGFVYRDPQPEGTYQVKLGMNAARIIENAIRNAKNKTVEEVLSKLALAVRQARQHPDLGKDSAGGNYHHGFLVACGMAMDSIRLMKLEEKGR